MRMNATKDEAVKIFALRNGWLPGWLKQQQEAMVDLYDREFDIEAVAMHCVETSSYSMDVRDYVRPDFLMAFFSPFPKIEIISLPEISLLIVDKPYTIPRVIEKSRYEDAWKFHIQKMVLLGTERLDYVQQRLDYLYQFIPKKVIDRFTDFRKEKYKRIYEKMRVGKYDDNDL